VDELYEYTGLLQKKQTVSTFHKTQTTEDIDTHDARFCRETLEVLSMQPIMEHRPIGS
jgi:hypothetical protein